jgi:hypothetical protein
MRIRNLLPALVLVACSAANTSPPTGSGSPADGGSPLPAAAGGDGGDATEHSSPGTGPNANVGSGQSPNAALKVLSFTSTVGTLTNEANSDDVTFIAIVIDTKGLDSIAGGALLDDSGATYGAFGAGSTKGTYTAHVTLADVDRVHTVEFQRNSSNRNFVAKFYDNDGNVATATLPIKLQCELRVGGAYLDACAGYCVDLVNDQNNCGSCGHMCPSGTRCTNSTCLPPSNLGCFEQGNYPARTCSEFCSAVGKTCVSANSYAPADTTCSKTATAQTCTSNLSTGSYVSCVCQ